MIRLLDLDQKVVSFKIFWDVLPFIDLIENPRLIIVNCLYFKAQWKNPFSPSETEEATFHRTNGDKMKCQMMFHEDEFNYLESDDFQVNKSHMVLLMFKRE